MNSSTRLDILMYAHDGRGLGHASRTIGIGLALRRLSPSLKILFLSGCKESQDLIGTAPLDWLKLPSYETIVTDGRSQGIKGNSNFDDKELGRLRGEQIKQFVRIYRPRIILADHSPQGKHRELLPALKDNISSDTRWVLGLRGITGNVSQVRSELAASIFQEHYQALLWYGDTQILGTDQIEAIHQQFSITPVECGYVSRMTELMKTSATHFGDLPALAGTVSIPWIGENSCDFLFRLAATLKKLGPQYGDWKLFIDSNHPNSKEIYRIFSNISFCTIEKPGQQYTSALIRSKMAIIYGGYNSIVDVLSLSLPALIILRDMQDNEQQIHIQKLLQSTGKNITPIKEQCSEQQLFTTLHSHITTKEKKVTTIHLNGAEKAANHLAAMLRLP